MCKPLVHAGHCVWTSSLVFAFTNIKPIVMFSDTQIVLVSVVYFWAKFLYYLHFHANASLIFLVNYELTHLFADFVIDFKGVSFLYLVVLFALKILIIPYFLKNKKIQT